MLPNIRYFVDIHHTLCSKEYNKQHNYSCVKQQQNMIWFISILTSTLIYFHMQVYLDIDSLSSVIIVINVVIFTARWKAQLCKTHFDTHNIADYCDYMTLRQLMSEIPWPGGPHDISLCYACHYSKIVFDKFDLGFVGNIFLKTHSNLSRLVILPLKYYSALIITGWADRWSIRDFLANLDTHVYTYLQ